jgi:polyribonucleotide nucleotidyltransferase
VNSRGKVHLIKPLKFLNWILHMVDYCRKELEWGGRRLVLETGKIARQAHSVVATYARNDGYGQCGRQPRCGAGSGFFTLS